MEQSPNRTRPNLAGSWIVRATVGLGLNLMGGFFMCSVGSLRANLYAYAAAGAISVAATSAFAACTGPGAPTDTQTKCLTAVPIPGNPLRSFDISWVNPDRAEYYLADRSNAAIDILDTEHNQFKRQLPGFVGIKLNGSGGVNNNISGPDGVATHGRWLYAGDGD